MFPHEVLKDLILETPSRIVFIVIDGVGGVPIGGKTELEAARKPNLDRIAREGHMWSYHTRLPWYNTW